MGTVVNTFHDEEIEQVIAEYLAAKEIAGRTPIDVAHEIVEVARVAVPKVRGRGRGLLWTAASFRQRSRPRLRNLGAMNPCGGR